MVECGEPQSGDGTMAPGKRLGQSPKITEALRVIFDEYQQSPTLVAEHLGVNRQTIYDWRHKGTEPAFSTGERILALAKRLQRGK